MHPVVILVPIAALAVVPGLWARRLLKLHNRHDLQGVPIACDLARHILDHHGLGHVRVECTDMGDHYDPVAKSVRLARDKYARSSLTAITTAAHEVAHALQDAAGYGPFVWRSRLVSLARATGQVGSVVLIAVPAGAVLGRRTIPPVLLGASLFAMLGTGLAAQLAALPTELDASFRRALPMLSAVYLDEAQAREAREILMAASSTYIAASLLSVLNIWPWVGVPRGGVPMLAARAAGKRGDRPVKPPVSRIPGRRASARPGAEGPLARGLRLVGKPLIRAALQLSHRRGFKTPA